MTGKPIPPLRPDSPPSAVVDALNRLARAVTDADDVRGTSSGGITVGRQGGGIQIRDAVQQPIFARIGSRGAGAKYDYTRVIDNGDGTFSDAGTSNEFFPSGLSTTDPACEVNGRTDVPVGSIVTLFPGVAGWTFSFTGTVAGSLLIPFMARITGSNAGPPMVYSWARLQLVGSTWSDQGTTGTLNAYQSLLFNGGTPSQVTVGTRVMMWQEPSGAYAFVVSQEASASGGGWLTDGTQQLKGAKQFNDLLTGNASPTSILANFDVDVRGATKTFGLSLYQSGYTIKANLAASTGTILGDPANILSFGDGASAFANLYMKQSGSTGAVGTLTLTDGQVNVTGSYLSPQTGVVRARLFSTYGNGTSPPDLPGDGVSGGYTNNIEYPNTALIFTNGIITQYNAPNNGDLLYCPASPANRRWMRLGIGTAGQVLTAVNTGGGLEPVWQTPSSPAITGATPTTLTGVIRGNGSTLSGAELSGDVTTSGSNATTIAADAVTLAKMANVATSTVFYRKTAGTGDPEVQTLATLKTDLGLTGTNSGDQTITLTGDVTGSGTGSFATTLATVPVAKGGTGATTAGAARTGLGVPALIGNNTLTGDNTLAGETTLQNGGTGSNTLTFQNSLGSAVGSVSNAGNLNMSGTGTFGGTVTATTFSGSGASLTSVPASSLTGTLPSGSFPALTGDVTTTAGSFTTTIAPDAVTLAKMANVATGTVFYRKTAGTGDPEVQTLATLKTDLGLTGTNSGDQYSPPPGALFGSSSVNYSDQASFSTLYYLPVAGQLIRLYSGGVWGVCDLSSSGISIALSGLQWPHVYDVFCFVSGSTPTLELLPWKNATVTADNTTDKITWTGHGLTNDEGFRRVSFSTTGTMPTGLTANTPYYLQGVTANDFQITANPGGTAINFTSNGTGTLTCWSSSVRGTALAYQDGFLVKSGDPTRLYLGTIGTTAANASQDTESQRLIYNHYNRLPRTVRNDLNSGGSWTYSTSTVRAANGSYTNCVEFISGVDYATAVDVTYMALCGTNAGAAGLNGVAINTANAFDTKSKTSYSQNTAVSGTSRLSKRVAGSGFFAAFMCEKGNGTITSTWYGSTDGVNFGMVGTIF